MPPIPTVTANGCAIRAFRQIQNLSIESLSERAGVARSAIHGYEHGRKRPTLRSLMQVAQGLGVPPQAICMDDLCRLPADASR